MKIKKSNWQIEGHICSYCEQGELIFSKCPSCGSIVLECAECSTVYEIKEKKVGKEIGESLGGTKCTACTNSLHQDFDSASAEEIRNLGFETGEYS